MRSYIDLNRKWAFAKDTTKIPTSVPQSWCLVNLPHTWNAIDGQDGDNDYFRGSCVYIKKLLKRDLPQYDKYFLEINGANSQATVYVNGKKLFNHSGGYSCFRVDITRHLTEENLIAIAVDNSANDHVYPQSADFTFYGGIYRDVRLICTNESHFELEYYGTPGIKITPVITGNDANVEIEVFIANQKEDHSVHYSVYDAEGERIAYTESNTAKTVLTIKNVHLWHGRKDPYLYKASAVLCKGGKETDRIYSRFGCRSFYIDPQKGFILNGMEYPLRGVARHQDRWGIGNALLPCHHREDAELICELGANTVRLAHYQQSDYFYDLCDEKGLIVWAEIPYISKHMPSGRDNTLSQLKELIIQNYNHPSIAVWGLSNEITMGGEDDPDLLENHRVLNDLAHALDRTRPTVMACLTMCSTNSEIIKIPDAIAYNHYFGWYGGDTSMNGPWFDEFHKKHPNIPIGCSEYGCEALNWHSSDPVQGDYTEEYQAYYHEELIKQLYPKKYLWATYVWNMFDFGADARNEGGENGQNHKGLVTFDRSYKKDAFYAYKAWLSDKPFVHICSKRYINRAEYITTVKVYSNQKEVELFANGISLGKKSAADHFFSFEVPLKEQTRITAKAGGCTDESIIRRVESFCEDYRMKEKGALLNWFDISAPEGYFSLNDKVESILHSNEGKMIFAGLSAKMAKGTAGFEVTPDLMQMMGGFTLIRLINLMGSTGVSLTKEELLELNAKLNAIPK